MTTFLKIAVIIPSIGRDSLKKTLYSLNSQTHKPDEVIVVFSKTNKEIRNFISFFRSRCHFDLVIYRTKKAGSTYSRNLGIRKARYGIVAFLDDDCIADKKWISRILDFYKSHKKSFLKGKTINLNNNNIYSLYEYIRNETLYNICLTMYKNNIFSSLLDSKNFAAPKYIIKKYMFDNIFSPYSLFEDIDLGRRIQIDSIRIYHDNDMTVIHKGRSNLLNHLYREYNKGKAMYLFSRKWKSWRNTLMNSKNIFKEKNQKFLKIFQKNMETIKIDKFNRIRKKAVRVINISFRLKYFMVELFSLFAVLAGYYEMVILNFPKGKMRSRHHLL